MTRELADPSAPIDRLLRLMSMLRDPRFGCPWDLKQTFETLIPHTMEEAHEVVQAIESGDRDELRDELGDLLFQIVFYAQLSREEGGFDFQDVAAEVTAKLIRRHPHVFPDGRLESFGIETKLSATEVVDNWEAIKRAERAEKEGGIEEQGKEAGTGGGEAAGNTGNMAAIGEKVAAGSVLDGVPHGLPAVEQARKMQQRVAGVGFDWTETPPVLDKLKEELGEFERALAVEDVVGMREELGDLLFAIVNLARHCKLDCESALRQSNRRFEARFREVERLAAGRGWRLSERELGELDGLWARAKSRVRDREARKQLETPDTSGEISHAR